MRNKVFYLWSCILLLSLTLGLGNSAYAQNIQQKRWILNNQSIDFTVDPPLVVSGLPQFPGIGISDGPANGVHDAQGNLLFYVDSDKVIRNKFGSPIGAGQPSLGLTPSLGSELCIVPVPETNCCSMMN
jgi:hypothetical protein